MPDLGAAGLVATSSIEVALAACLFEAPAVNNAHVSSPVRDRALALARRRCQRQRASVDAQNRCDIFVRERKQVPDHAIVHGEKPARKARRYRVHPVAGDGLKVLKHNGINVEQGHATNRLTRVEKGGKPFGRHDQGSAPNLYLATADISTNDRQKAERALAASHGRL